MTLIQRKYFSTAVILACVAALIGIFSANAIWLSDEVFYQFNLAKDGIMPLTTLGDVVDSQNAHYFMNNGRYVAHFIVQCFCGLWGKAAFAICNALAYVLFYALLCRLSHVSMTNVRGVIGIVIVGLLTFQTTMAPACQVGYIWMFSLTMAVLVLFFSGGDGWAWWKYVVAGVFSLIAGNGQEALNLGVSAAMAIYLLQNRRMATPHRFVIAAAFCIGTLIDCLSPGTRNRADVFYANQSFMAYGEGFLKMLMWLRASYILVAVVLWKFIKNHLSFRQIYAANTFYWNVFFIMLAFNLVLGTNSNRQFFGMELMAIVLTFRLLKGHALPLYWTVALGLLTAGIYVLQGEYLFRSKRNLEMLGKRYAASANGIVYANIDETTPLMAGTRLVSTIHWDNNPLTLWEEEMLRTRLVSDYGDHGRLNVVPEFLRGKENTDLGNRIIHLNGDFYLAVQSKNRPACFFVEREHPLKPTPENKDTIFVDMDNRSLAEGHQWRAIIINVKSLRIMRIGKCTPKFQ